MNIKAKIITALFIALCALSAWAEKPKVEADFSLQATNELFGLSFFQSGMHTGPNDLFWPWSGALLKAQCDLRLGDHWVVSPMVEAGLMTFNLMNLDGGCGVGYTVVDRATYRLDLIGTSFGGVWAYWDVNPLVGARVEAVNRFTLFGKLKGIVSAGVEWRYCFWAGLNGFSLPLSLGFSF